MKYLVETTGDFMLSDGFVRQIVHPFRPTVVVASAFIENSIGTKLKKLDILDDLADDATLQSAKTPEELEAAIKALPRPGAPAAEKPATTRVTKK